MIRFTSIVCALAGFLGATGAVAAQATSRVSLGSGGAQANGDSSFPVFLSSAISADGRYVVFESAASNLVPGDTNGFEDIFVHDRWTGATERVSVDSSGAQADSESYAPAISADGRYVAFESVADNLVPGDTNVWGDYFVHDRLSGTTERVNVDSSGAQADYSSGYAAPAISADGRYVAFQSEADNLVAGDTNVAQDVFVHDRQTGATEMVSVDSAGIQGTIDSVLPSISADGRFVAFMSLANNLAVGDTNVASDVFVHDRQTGTTEIVSVDSSGVAGWSDASFPSISSDGRYVAFDTLTNLEGGIPNGYIDVYVHDRQTGTTELVSADSTGAEGNGVSDRASLSADGRFVVFESQATSLVPGDTNALSDIYVRDRAYAPMTSLCDPGAGGVIACPCSNPPGAPGRGCDNSAATGGASLAASGGAYLFSDGLVFTTAGEKPTATSILLQGTTSPAAGVPYGQGVRCVGGTLKRLFVKAASGGSITAPDFGAGDPSVSVRSAARGDVIGAGQSRFYLVYYRDPVVLGGCSPTSTFNATQTGRVDWLP